MIDINQLQSAIAALNQIVDQVASIIPGPTGDKVRAVIQFLETIEANPLVQQLLVLLLDKLTPNMTLDDLKAIVAQM